ncbi:hypothetical protein [Gordonia soli]|nr:hypothetical protein [Gordonia soli]
MKRSHGRSALLALAAVAALAASSCSTDSNDQSPSSSSAPASAAAATNARGAIEVELGQPVSVNNSDGSLLVRITDSKLDAAGCKTVDYSQIPELAKEGLKGQIRQVKFAAMVQIGTTEMPEWLWSSDFYFVSRDGEVTDNLTVSQMSDELSSPCSGNKQIIDLPPNSKAQGASTIEIPIGSGNGGPIAIGYKAKDRRVEWRLPADWAKKLAPPTAAATPAQQTEGVPAPTTEQQAKATFTCGDPQTYQRGTAIYSDGSTGYEQACAGPGETNPYGPQTRGDAVPETGTPDPNSADGYGPGQPLPPLCVRFPDQYDC